jgi:hypothetical protein
VGKLSRRRFFINTLAPLTVGEPALQVLLNNPLVESATHASDPALPEGCPECDGWGRMTCPACEGTTMWTEASESAGCYQREVARRADHCAWCDEWGEIMCPECEGFG